MENLVPKEPRAIDWSVAARPISGQCVSGDMHLVKAINHCVLLAVIDGIGHGEEAALAARSAAEILDRHAIESTISLIKRCHDALVRTRGVVLTIAKLDTEENSMTWLGVGNVEGRLLRADASAGHPRERVLMRSGLIGYEMPALQASVIPVAVGDVLVLATDGIDTAFEEGIHLSQAPRQIADNILSRYFKGSDDALVLVARYLGAHRE